MAFSGVLHDKLETLGLGCFRAMIARKIARKAGIGKNRVFSRNHCIAPFRRDFRRDSGNLLKNRGGSRRFDDYFGPMDSPFC